MKQNNNKVYALICADFGRKFAFNAKDEKEANDKKYEWCRYHSFSSRDYSIEDVTGQNLSDLQISLHNEYFD